MTEGYKKAIEAALNRRTGMPEADSKKLNDFLATQEWWALCPKCGVDLKGTPAKLKEHRCGSTS